MSAASAWTAVWPVITFVGGIAAQQVLEWGKNRRSVQQEVRTRQQAVADHRHEYEIKTLSDLHAVLSDLVTALAMSALEAQKGPGGSYAKEAVTDQTQLAVGQGLLRANNLSVVVFDGELRGQLEAFLAAAASMAQARTQEESDERWRVLRDESPLVADLVGERIRNAYAELEASVHLPDHPRRSVIRS